MRLALTVVCTSGVGTLDPFHFARKYPDTDNASR